ncbi:unnamed protein product, partial [Arabidopsis halleri]
SVFTVRLARQSFECRSPSPNGVRRRFVCLRQIQCSLGLVGVSSRFCFHGFLLSPG